MYTSLDRNEVLVGELLGDGCLSLNKGKKALYRHTSKFKQYLEWLQTKLSWLQGQKIYEYDDIRKPNYDRLYYQCSICSRKSDYLTEYFYEFYKEQNGRPYKVLPKDLELTPTIIKHWYLGDGTVYNRYFRVDNTICYGIEFCSEAFTKQEQEFLALELEYVTGIPFHLKIKNRDKGTYRLTTYDKHIKPFLTAIYDEDVPECYLDKFAPILKDEYGNSIEKENLDDRKFS